MFFASDNKMGKKRMEIVIVIAISSVFNPMYLNGKSRLTIAAEISVGEVVYIIIELIKIKENSFSKVTKLFKII